MERSNAVVGRIVLKRVYIFPFKVYPIGANIQPFGMEKTDSYDTRGYSPDLN